MSGKSIYLFPKFNSSQAIGREFLEEIDKLRQRCENLMSEFSSDPETIPNLSKSIAIARNVLGKLSQIDKLNLEDFLVTKNSNDKKEKELEKELLSFYPNLPLKKNESKCLEIIDEQFKEYLSDNFKAIKKKKLKDWEKELKENFHLRAELEISKENFNSKDVNDSLKKYFDGEFPIERDLDVCTTMINEIFLKNYKSWDEFVTSFKKNEIDYDVAREILKGIFRLTPKFKILAQTPNFIFIPLISPIKYIDDAKVNTAIRELFISIIFSLKLNCSVAIANSVKQLTLFDKIGSVFVEENSYIRNLVGDSWLHNFDFINEKGFKINSMKTWLEAIASTLLISHLTNYSDRTNLLEILTSKTKGHLLRRIELQDEKESKKKKMKITNATKNETIKHIEKIWEVRR